MPIQQKHLHVDAGHHSWVTVAPPVVESSEQSTTTTTVITFSTTTVSKDMTETPPKSEENAKSARDHPPEVKDEEDLETISSEPRCRPQSETGQNIDQHPEFFGCLHCEQLRPWPMAALHICLRCIREWKWCAKGAHNQPKASFFWNDVEHDECYVCHFADA
jgi:hypothetical protein